jgi:hypothetical protein
MACTACMSRRACSWDASPARGSASIYSAAVSGASLRLISSPIPSGRAFDCAPASVAASVRLQKNLPEEASAEDFDAIVTTMSELVGELAERIAASL